MDRVRSHATPALAGGERASRTPRPYLVLVSLILIILTTTVSVLSFQQLGEKQKPMPQLNMAQQQGDESRSADSTDSSPGESQLKEGRSSTERLSYTWRDQPTAHPPSTWQDVQPTVVSPAAAPPSPNACEAPWRLQLQSHLKRIVLVVNYNHPEYTLKSVHFLQALYAFFFLKVVILAPTSVPQAGVQARSPDSFSLNWYGSYMAFEGLIQENPDAEGFLWMSDDVALNYWHLLSANMSKIWVKRYDGKNFPFAEDEPTNVTDLWAGRPEHRKSARLAFHDMGEPYKEQFNESMLPHHGLYPKRVIDLLYLPMKHAVTIVKDLIPHFRRHVVQWEIAMPMMLFSVEDPRNYDSVLDDMEYSWEHYTLGDQYDPLNYWSPNISALHPWKLSSASAKLTYVESLGQIDPCLLTLKDFATQTIHFR